MGTTLKARIIKIGNSRGVRIPKTWLEQLNFKEEVELAVEPDIVIRPVHRRREGWERQFHEMSARGDDQLLDPLTLTAWEQDDFNAPIWNCVG